MIYHCSSSGHLIFVYHHCISRCGPQIIDLFNGEHDSASDFPACDFHLETTSQTRIVESCYRIIASFDTRVSLEHQTFKNFTITFARSFNQSLQSPCLWHVGASQEVDRSVGNLHGPLEDGCWSGGPRWRFGEFSFTAIGGWFVQWIDEAPWRRWSWFGWKTNAKNNGDGWNLLRMPYVSFVWALGERAWIPKLHEPWWARLHIPFLYTAGNHDWHLEKLNGSLAHFWSGGDCFFLGGSPENKLSSLGRLRDCLGCRIDIVFLPRFCWCFRSCVAFY